MNSIVTIFFPRRDIDLSPCKEDKKIPELECQKENQNFDANNAGTNVVNKYEAIPNVNRLCYAMFFVQPSLIVLKNSPNNPQ
jgi:hypothetical protein